MKFGAQTYQILNFWRITKTDLEKIIDMVKNQDFFENVCKKFAEKLRVGTSMDSKRGVFVVAGKKCAYFYLEGFLNKQALERVMTQANGLEHAIWDDIKSAKEFVDGKLYFAESIQNDFDSAVKMVLSGFLVLLFEGFESEFLAIEARITPQRSIQEPSKGKTLRGPHEGYCENIVTNLALLRRRIKTERLIIKDIVIGDIADMTLPLHVLLMITWSIVSVKWTIEYRNRNKDDCGND